MRLKKRVAFGATKENPARTKKAAANPSHGGPVRNARIEKRTAEPRDAAPARSQPLERRAECSTIAPALSARTGSIFAAASAGSHAAPITEIRPRKIALTQIQAATETCCTLSST